MRKEGNRWILLHDGGAWNDIGHGLAQGGTFHLRQDFILLSMTTSRVFTKLSNVSNLTVLFKSGIWVAEFRIE